MRTQLRKAVRRATSVLAVVAVVAIAVPVEAANSPQVQGTKCAKVRATRVVKGVSYSCAKVGKTKKWQIVNKKAPTSTTSPTSPTSTTVPKSGIELGHWRLYKSTSEAAKKSK